VDKVCALGAIVHPVVNGGGLFAETVWELSHGRNITFALRSRLAPDSVVLIIYFTVNRGRSSKGEAILAFINYDGAVGKVLALGAIVHPVVNGGGLFAETM